MKLRLTALILAAVLLLCGCAKTEPQPSIDRPHVAFSDMVYERPDMDRLLTDLDRLHEQYFVADSPQARDEVMAAINRQMLHFLTMYALADLRSAIDVTDPYYAGELAFLAEARGHLSQCSRQFYERLLLPENEALARELFSEPEYTALSRDLQTESAATQPLRAEEEQWILQYKAAAAQIGSMGSADALCDAVYDSWSGLFLRLAELRHTQAKALGYTDFSALAWERMGRCGYTQQDVTRFREAVKAELVPAYRALLQRAAAKEGWIIPPLHRIGQPIERPDAWFEPDTLLAQFGSIYREMSPDTGDCIDYLLECELYDLQPSPTKYPGGFQEYLYEYASPFLFGSFRGNAGDVSLFSHEFGHVFAAYRKILPDPAAFCDIDRTMDIREIHSSGMEMLTMSRYADLFGEDAAQMQQAEVARLVGLIIDCCMYDEWQYRVYTEWERIAALPDPAAELDAITCELRQDYYGPLDCTGLRAYGDGKMWIAKTHLFEAPFYMIDYALAYSVTLQLVPLVQSDPGKAYDTYLAMVDAPAGSDFSAVVRASGLHSPFSAQTVSQLAQLLTNLQKQ